MTLLQAAREGRSTLGGPVIPGLALGFAGVALLVEPSRLLGGQPIDPFGAVVLLTAAISWSFGSIIGSHARLPESISMTTGMTLLTGSTLLLAGSIAGGEAAAIMETTISARSLGGLIYQLVLGSIVAFGCYTWLLRVSTPSRVSTYAFVNPLVAVFLGWILGSEELTARIGVATVLMVGAVALINLAGSRRRGGAPAPIGEVIPGDPHEPVAPALEPEEA
jgi:drug/metabolite transporter (DMT)-like permease